MMVGRSHRVDATSYPGSLLPFSISAVKRGGDGGGGVKTRPWVRG